MMRHWGKAAICAVVMGWGVPAGAQDAAGVSDQASAAGLSPAEMVWHVRAALNVAALGCRGPQEAATVAGYNALLAAERVALAAASDDTAAQYKARFGAAWQARFDDDMTRLYNFWARPAAHDGFCATAEAVLRDAAVVEPSAFGAFAMTALARLEEPFAAPAPVPPAPAAPVTLVAAAAPVVAGPVLAGPALAGPVVAGPVVVAESAVVAAPAAPGAMTEVAALGPMPARPPAQ